jgi:membrane associated rhomboid family serine protease
MRKFSVTLGVCGSLFVAGILSLFNPAWLTQGALQTEAVQRGEIWRLVIFALLHANLLHLWLNLMLLCLIGFGLEPRIGHGHFSVIFVSGILGGALLHLLAEDRTIYALGASGGIYALLCALIVILHRKRKALTALERFYLDGLVALAWAGIIAGFAVNALPDFPFRAGNAAHIGGGLTGFMLGWWISQPNQLFKEDAR